MLWTLWAVVGCLFVSLVGVGVALHAIRCSARELRELVGDHWDQIVANVRAQDRAIGRHAWRIDNLAANTNRSLESLTERVSHANEWRVSCHDLTAIVSRNDVDGSWTCGCGFGEDRIEATEDTAYAAIQSFRAHAYRRRLEEHRRQRQ